MKHLLKLGDLSREEILSILNLADQLKFERNNGIQKEYLKGKKLGDDFPEGVHPHEGFVRGRYVRTWRIRAVFVEQRFADRQGRARARTPPACFRAISTA